jgi:hypothetical protein
MKLSKLLKQWLLEGLEVTDKLETEYFQLNELNIDPLNSYEYEEIQLPIYTKSYKFNDRCGNTLVVVFTQGIDEFKSGYKIQGVDSLVFDPKKYIDVENGVKPCPDDKRVNTVYKILLEEIVPQFLLNKKPSKIWFNPVSDSRNKLTSIIINKIIKVYPHLITSNNYLINK